MKYILLLTFALSMTACESLSTSGERAPSSEVPAGQPVTELGESWTPENDRQSEEIVKIFKVMLEEKMKTERVVHRDAHPKHHACVKAELEINPSKLPPELQAGLYSKPGKYNAWVRFSNGDPDANKPDIEGDIRGMAMKILNVPGSPTGNQDMVMINSDRFFSRDGKDYLELSKALTGGGVKLGWYLLKNPKNALIINSARVKVASSLWVNYFSAVPYKLGNRSMRFSVIPCAQNGLFKDIPKGKPSANYIRERLESTLSQQDSCFDLYVQPNMEPEKNIIENPTFDWDKKKSPTISVGRIIIPKQMNITAKEQMNFCENISMDPWRSHPDNRPLGQINRIRKIVYPEISKFRHNANRTVVMEPKNLTPCQGETAALCQEP